MTPEIATNDNTANAPQSIAQDFQHQMLEILKRIEFGEAKAVYELGDIFRDGRGIDQNTQMARACYRHADKLAKTPRAIAQIMQKGC